MDKETKQKIKHIQKLFEELKNDFLKVLEAFENDGYSKVESVSSEDL